MPHPFTPAWLDDDAAAIALLPRSYADPTARAAAVRAAASRRAHPAVVESLRATTTAQRQARDALSQPGTTAVVTGQQAGLFGGPLYTIYKAAAAIQNARALADQTGRPCVPVFWLQSEDHDYDEIAAATTLAADGTLIRVRAPADPGPENRSIRHRILDPTAAHAALGLALAGLPHATAACDLLQRCWQPGCTPDAAFSRWIEALFAEHGLLVLDPSHPDLIDAAAPLHRRALAEAGPISAVLQARSQALASAGFAVQVHVRPDAPLGFVHPDGRDGPRYRVEPEGEAFRLCGTDRTIDATALHLGPHSTSALLRPILQDHWLPTAAYVGGPGEIAYFAQLPPLYAHFDLPMPLVVPRAHFRVVDPASTKLLAQLGIAADRLGEPRDQLLAALASHGDGPDPDALLSSLIEPARRALVDFEPTAAALDLDRSASKTADSLTYAATRLVDRYRRALADRDAVTTSRLDRALDRLQPGGAPQERVHSWPGYGARYGVDGFVRAVLDATHPFDGTLRELSV